MEQTYNFNIKTYNNGSVKREIFLDKKTKQQIGILLISPVDAPYFKLYIPIEKKINFVGYYSIREAYDYIHKYNTFFGRLLIKLGNFLSL